MFTGIIEAIGTITAIEPKGSDQRMRINTDKLDMSDVRLGDSIAVSGVCLTAVQLESDGFWADVSGETISCTVFSELSTKTLVNLEKALTPTTRLGGHLVTGHVDGVGKVLKRMDDGRSVRIQIEAPKSLGRYIAAKGSICVDGVSLTVNSVDGSVFDLNIVPHTLDETTMSDFQTGRHVNLEVDIIARYLERLLSGEQTQTTSITEELLVEYGFIK